MSAAQSKSESAKEASCLAALWLEHPWVAHAAHEAAASAHEKEATGADRELHLRLAKEHRASAQYWAKRELDKEHFFRPDKRTRN